MRRRRLFRATWFLTLKAPHKKVYILIGLGQKYSAQVLENEKVRVRVHKYLEGTLALFHEPRA